MVRTAQYVSPIGRLHLAERDEKLIGIWIEGQKYFPVSLEEVQEDAASPVLRQAAAWLDRYFQKKRPAPQELPLAPEGSGFRKEVWRPCTEYCTLRAVSLNLCHYCSRQFVDYCDNFS